MALDKLLQEQINRLEVNKGGKNELFDDLAEVQRYAEKQFDPEYRQLALEKGHSIMKDYQIDPDVFVRNYEIFCETQRICYGELISRYKKTL